MSFRVNSAILLNSASISSDSVSPILAMTDMAFNVRNLHNVGYTCEQFTTSHGVLESVDTTVLVGSVVSNYVNLGGRNGHIVGIAHEEDLQVVLRVAGSVEVHSVDEVRQALDSKARASFDWEHRALCFRYDLRTMTFSTPNPSPPVAFPRQARFGIRNRTRMHVFSGAAFVSFKLESCVTPLPRRFV